MFLTLTKGKKEEKKEMSKIYSKCKYVMVEKNMHVPLTSPGLKKKKEQPRESPLDQHTDARSLANKRQAVSAQWVDSDSSADKSLSSYSPQERALYFHSHNLNKS